MIPHLNIISLIALAALLTTSSQPLTPPQKPAHDIYEVYALAYGVYPDYSVANFVAGADKNRKIDAQMMIWLIKGPGGRNILVDAGCYYDTVLAGKGIKNFIKPSDTLAKVGLSPSQITDVIISHMHWDHVDGIDLFPNAKICPELIVPGHDPAVFVRFPRPGHGVARIP